MEGPITVYVVDDQEVIHTALKVTFKGHDIQIVGTSLKMDGVIESWKEINPDVVIIDLNLSEGKGLDLINQMIEINPAVKILAFSFQESIHIISAIYKAGARGYLTKSASLDQIREAVGVVALGGRYFIPDIQEKMVELLVDGDNNPQNVLTRKEFEIFILLAEGHSREEISQKLNIINERTLINKIKIIENKLGYDRTNFYKKSLKYGLINLVPGEY